MFKKFLITSFILIANISLLYSKDEPITFACLPPEGTMEEKARASYVSAVEGAFIKAGHNVADRQRLENIMKEMALQGTSNTDDAVAKAGKLMKVDCLVAVIVDSWEEEKLDTRSIERDRKKDVLKLKEEYILTYDYTRITLRIIEVETSVIIAQGNVQDYSIGYRKVTPDKLAKKVVNKVMKDVKKELKKRK